jgi:hypothetical protein
MYRTLNHYSMSTSESLFELNGRPLPSPPVTGSPEPLPLAVPGAKPAAAPDFRICAGVRNGILRASRPAVEAGAE